jgi:hypothetical protein
MPRRYGRGAAVWWLRLATDGLAVNLLVGVVITDILAAGSRCSAAFEWKKSSESSQRIGVFLFTTRVRKVQEHRLRK